MLALEPNPPAVRPVTDVQLARLKEIYPDSARALAKCVTCRNEGVFRWRGPDGEPVDYACDCKGQLELHLWLLDAGLDLRYQRLSWDDVTGVDRDVTKAVHDYMINAEAYAGSGIGLVLYGMRGNGKTLLSTLLLKSLMGGGRSGYFTTFQNMLDLYTSGWRSPEEKAWFDKAVRHTGVLVVDDMGRENDGRFKVAEEAFDHVLRARVAADRPTIVTSNKTLDELGQLYSLNALSLLDESTVKIEFSGEDFRPQQQTRRMEEAKLGLRRPVVLA
jgi:DNA replication protein DnaC